MKKKALLISSISVLFIITLTLVISNLIRIKPINIEDSVLIPQEVIYNYEGEIQKEFVAPNYFIKDNMLSYSVVGQMPLNEFGHTDLGELYEIELNTSNFDDLFKTGGAWAKGCDAKYLRENCMAALRADITEGVMLTEIPLGERFYYILFVKDEIYICLNSNGEMLQVLEVDIKNEEINSSFKISNK